MNHDPRHPEPTDQGSEAWRDDDELCDRDDRFYDEEEDLTDEEFYR